jgi:photosystem II stability/assembly factor-like uncharacterized protein
MTSSRTMEKSTQIATPSSSRVTKIGDLPAKGAWIHVQFVNENVCFFSTPSGIWRSADGGRTWEAIHQASDYQETVMRVQFRDPKLGWMETHNGWYTSEDGGVHWTPFETPLTSSGRLNGIMFINPEIGWLAGAALRPPSQEELRPGRVPNVPRDLLDDLTGKVLTPAIYRTDDGGKTWAFEKVSSNLGSIEDITFVDSNYGIALSGPEAFHTSDGGKTWIKVRDPQKCVDDRDGVYEGRPASAYLLGSSFQWIAFDDSRLLKSNNGGQTWTEAQPCDQARPVVVHFSSPEHGVGLGSDGSLYETSDAGISWSKADTNKYDSLSFMGKDRAWLVSERGLFRLQER